MVCLEEKVLEPSLSSFPPTYFFTEPQTLNPRGKTWAGSRETGEHSVRSEDELLSAGSHSDASVAECRRCDFSCMMFVQRSNTRQREGKHGKVELGLRNPYITHHHPGT
jgi:hypothetical protein